MWGAAVGAVGGLQAGAGAIVLSPALAVIAGAAGVACAAGAAEHPTAEADFQRILSEADTAIFRTTLEQRLNAPRAACDRPRASGGAPDAFFHTTGYTIGMGCLSGNQTIMVTVQWRLSDAGSGSALAERVRMCSLTSPRTHDAWIADPAYARKDVEQLLSRTAGVLAEELPSVSSPPRTCAFRPDESVESGAR